MTRVLISVCVCVCGAVVMGNQGGATTTEDPTTVCIANVQEYWRAHRDRDAEAAVRLCSPSGMYVTASDGSFHKPKRVQTLELQKQRLAQLKFDFQVYFPEAVLLSKDVVQTRYYLEGLLTTDKRTAPYRTRVTQIWVKEDGKWLAKSQHFSSAAYGGVYITQQEAYERN